MLRKASPALGILVKRSSSTAPSAVAGKIVGKSGKKPRVIILGTGWSAFRMIRTLDLKAYDVCVVSPRNHFLFTPLLAETAVGTLEFRSIIEPIRKSQLAKQIEYFQGECIGIDPTKKTITCKEMLFDKDLTGGLQAAAPFELSYDKLVIAVGAKNNTFGIKGVEANAHFLKELKDARSIRKRIIDIFEHVNMPSVPAAERKVMLNFVIVGGGPTGVEFAGELADFFWDDLQKCFPNAPIDEVKITLLEAGNAILTAFDKNLVRTAHKTLKKRGVDVRTNSVVVEVQPDKVILADGSSLPYGLLVWSTGVGPRPFIHSIDVFKKDKSGRILVNSNLQVLDRQDIYAMGDCAAIEGNLLQATAQVAQQQGKYMADTFNLMAEESPAKINPFKYRFIGLMTYVGHHNSLLDSEHLKSSGFGTWIAWRSAYLTRLGTLKNKMQVPFDWFRTTVFGRDVTSF